MVTDPHILDPSDNGVMRAALLALRDAALEFRDVAPRLGLPHREDLTGPIGIITANLELLSLIGDYHAALRAFSEAEPVHNRADDSKDCRLCAARDRAMKLLDRATWEQWHHEGPFTDEYGGPIPEGVGVKPLR